jgi:hypothetical protein
MFISLLKGNMKKPKSKNYNIITIPFHVLRNIIGSSKSSTLYAFRAQNKLQQI